MTACGALICDGCDPCVRSWAAVEGLRLAAWQRALVDEAFPKVDPPINQALARRPELAQSTYRGVVVRAALLESA